MKVRIEYNITKGHIVYAAALLIESGESLSKKRVLKKIRDNIKIGAHSGCSVCLEEEADYYLNSKSRKRVIREAKSFFYKNWTTE